MPCYTRTKRNQTVVQRKAEVKKRVAAIDRLIAAGKVKIKVGPQGAAVLIDLPPAERDDLTDVCILRLLTNGGASAKTKIEIMKAEQLAGRSISKQAIEAGWHSHDAGGSWGRD